MIHNSVLYNSITLVISIKRKKIPSRDIPRKWKYRKQSRVRTCLEEFAEYIYVFRKEILLRNDYACHERWKNTPALFISREWRKKMWIPDVHWSDDRETIFLVLTFETLKFKRLFSSACIWWNENYCCKSLMKYEISLTIVSHSNSSVNNESLARFLPLLSIYGKSE